MAAEVGGEEKHAGAGARERRRRKERDGERERHGIPCGGGSEKEMLYPTVGCGGSAGREREK